MKRFLSLLIALAMLAACAAALANVRFSGSAYLYKSRGGAKTKIIMKKGSVVKDVKRDKTWTQVRLTTGEKYWVRTKYVKKTSGKINEVYNGGGSGRSKAGKEVADKTGKYIQVNVGKLNVRSEASLSGKILGIAKRGTRLPYRKAYSVDSRGQKWWKVTYRGKVGWVSEGRVLY